MPVGAAAGLAFFAAGSTGALVTAAVVNGAIAGALIGGATSALSGGNVFKGALKGALVGGIASGVLQGAGIANLSGMSTSAAETAATVGAGAGAETGAINKAVETVGSQVPGAINTAGPVTEGTKGLLVQANPALTPTASTAGGATIDATIAASRAAGAETGKYMLYAGGIQGLGTGLGNWSAARTRAEADQELFDRQTRQRNESQPIDWKSQAPRITTPAENIVNTDEAPALLRDWRKYFMESPPVKGLLQGRMTA